MTSFQPISDLSKELVGELHLGNHFRSRIEEAGRNKISSLVSITSGESFCCSPQISTSGSYSPLSLNESFIFEGWVLEVLQLVSSSFCSPVSSSVRSNHYDYL